MKDSISDGIFENLLLFPVNQQFTQSRNVIRKDIQSTTKLPADDILEMLTGVASMRHGHGWNFRLDHDVEFCNKYPDIVKTQNAFWDHKVKALLNQVHRK